MANETISKLNTITDAALFERIASAILRASNPNIYGNISHQGVNPSGKTIKAPLDNVGWYHDQNEDTLIAVAHTTAKRENLESKWLHNSAEVTPRKSGSKPTQPDGDLVKAIKEIAKIKEIYPSLNARLALTCNCEEPQNLRIKVQQLASLHNIYLDIWSVSRLAQFLDIDPVGQAIRYNFFGILPTELSYDELLRIGKESLQGIPFNEENFIHRTISNNTTHCFLTGLSGVGKTTLCVNTITKAIKNNHAGIVISEQTILHSSSLEEALDTELRKYSSDLLPNSGKKALELSSIDKPLLILIEDINTANNTELLLKKLIDWLISYKQQIITWQLLCPIWSRYITSLEIEHKKFIEEENLVYFIDVYDDEQAKTAVLKASKLQDQMIDSLSAKSLAKKLGNDPLFIAIHDYSSLSSTINMIDSYIEHELTRIAHKNTLIVSDLEDAIYSLAFAIFNHKCLQPTWRFLKGILSNEHMQLIQLIANDGKVLRLRRSEKEDLITMRHDRILYHLIARSLVPILESNEQNNNLSDPYFAEIIGIAAVLCNLTEEKLTIITKINHLVSFYAFQYAVTNQQNYIQIALQVLKAWLLNENHRDSSFNQRRYATLNVLKDTFHPEVPNILSLYPQTDQCYLYHEIAFKHGNLTAVCYWLLTYEFNIEVTGRKEIIDFVYNKYGQSFVDMINRKLVDPKTSNKLLNSLLFLIGYIGEDIFANSVREAWNISQPEKRDLRLFLWAAARVCDSDPDSLLSPILGEWENLSNEQDETGISLRGRLAEGGLKWKFRDYPPHKTITYLVKQSKTREALKWPLIYMLSEIDNPETLQNSSEFLATIEHDGGHFHNFILDNLNRKADNKKYLSYESKQRLLAISNDIKNDKFLRKHAFSIWEASPNPEDINTLKNIEKNDPRYNKAIWGRARRKDLTVIPQLIEKIKEEPQFWWQAGRYIWDQNLTQLLIHSISQSSLKTLINEIWILPELFENLSIVEGEKILIENWAKISSDPMCFQTAIFLATPKLNKLINLKVKKTKNPKKLFEHFFVNITPIFRGSGIESGIRVEQLEAIKLYLKYLTDIDLYELWQICFKHHYRDFAFQYLEPLLKKSKYSNVTKIDASYLNKDLELKISHNGYSWLRHHLFIGWKRSELISFLFSWLEKNKTEFALEIVKNILSDCGDRTDYELLKNMDINLPNWAPVLEEIRFSIFWRTLN